MVRGRALRWKAFFLIVLICRASPSYFDSQGPTFIKEPSSRVDFSSALGIRIDCSAHGSPTPTISWLSADGKQIQSVPGLRKVFSNGTLSFHHFEPSVFRQDVHSATYRCVASNSVGKIFSRDVKVRAIVLQEFDVSAGLAATFMLGPVNTKSVTRGGTAILRCHIPSTVRDSVTVTSWLQDSSFNIYPSIKGDGKYHMLPTGELLIMDVGESDKFHYYQCRAVNRLSGHTQISTGRGARIMISEDRSEGSPRPLDNEVTIHVRKDESVILPCITEGHPRPAFRWYKKIKGGSGHFDAQLGLIHMDERVHTVDADQCLSLQHVQPDDTGTYLCVVNNTMGTDRLEIFLNVAYILIAAIQPPHATVDMGERSLFKCSHNAYKAHETTITWLKNGQQLQMEERFSITDEGTALIIEQVQKEDAGMYQCFVRTNDDSAQGTAELRLGAAHPQLLYKFISQIIQPGPAISLKCTATGSPTPQLYWTLDGFPLPNNDRYKIGQYVTIHGDVTSHVNISTVQIEDGGSYQCTAKNRVGEASHTAVLRIYGSPSIREMPNLSAVAGESLYITCPVAGYPIDTIIWEKGERKLPLNRRQHAFPNGTLVIENVQREADQGTYTCVVRNKQGGSAFQSVELSVIVPPRITPFTFQTDLHVGDRAGVQCFITKGDLPLDIIWQRDGIELSVTSAQPVSSDSIVVQRLSSYISSLSIDSLLPEHTANYTCVAKNNAASAQHSSQLLVNVPPRIGPFTFGDLIEGVRTQVQCVIQQGDPPLNLTWLKDEHSVPLELGIHIKNDDFSSTLVIPVVSLAHSGNYTCIASNQAKETRQSSSLVVSVPPRWMHEPYDQNVTRDNPVQFDCQAEGFPTPSIIWRKVIGKQPKEYQDLTIRSRGLQLFPNGSLYFHQAFQEHQGHYLCEATNGIGAGLSSVVNLIVHVPPEFEVKSAQSTVRRGSPVVLACEALGDNPMTITWQRESGRIHIHSEPRYAVKENEIKGGLLSELSILDTIKSDSGTYTCSASNPYGLDHRAVHLLVQDAPEQPQDVRVIDSDSRSIRVGWLFQNDEQSPVLQFVVQYHQDTGADSSGWDGSVLQSASVAGTAMVAMVAGLIPATTYRVRVFAENAQGPGEPSEALLVRTDSEPPGGAPQGLQAEPISSTELQVYWKPPIKITWNGELLGYYVGYREAGMGRLVGYNFTTVDFKSVEVSSENTSSSVKLFGLKKYRQYSIVVQAFNEKGPGPMSSEVVAITLEDVPSVPPSDIKCQARSSQGLLVSWQQPPPLFQNGIIIGYKISFENVQDAPNGKIESEIKISQELSTELHGLQKFANYSIQLLAYTRIGDGAKSAPIYCRTDEDAPDSPAGVKVISSSSTSLIVSWLPPTRPNGIIISYNVYTRVLEGGVEKNSLKKRLPSSQTHCEFRDLKKKESYEFWITGATKAGEGSSTQRVHSTVSSSGAAAIISFGTEILLHMQSTIILPCLVTGNPMPERTWLGPGSKPINKERILIQDNGSALIKGLIKEDEGNYTCFAKNDKGKDQITFSILVQVPPNPPDLKVLSASSESLNLSWTLRETGGSPIRFFRLQFRIKNDHESKWEEYMLTYSINEYELKFLQCGTEYELTMSATNFVGDGDISAVTTAKTLGRAPAAPNKSDFISVDVTNVTLDLNKWSDNGCKIGLFVVDYKEKGTNDWKNVGSIEHSIDKYYITGLWGGSRYIARVSATNGAGTTSAEYPILTIPPPHGRHVPDLKDDLHANTPFFTDVSLIVTLGSACGFIAIVITALCLRMNFCGPPMRRAPPPPPPPREEPTYSDDPFCAQHVTHEVLQQQIMPSFNGKHSNFMDREQFYAAMRKNSIHTPIRAINSGLECRTEFAEDIYPYSIFQMQSQQQYSSSANFDNFLYQDDRLPPMELIPMQHFHPSNLNHNSKSFRSESEDYDSLGSDSDPDQASVVRSELNHPRGEIMPGVHRRTRDVTARRSNTLYPAPESSTSTEPSPLMDRRSAIPTGPNRHMPTNRNQQVVDCAPRHHLIGGAFIRSRPNFDGNATNESSFITANSFPMRLDPPKGFTDFHEPSEAECDIDTLHRIKLRQQAYDQAKIQSRPLPPRDPKQRNFVVTV